MIPADTEFSKSQGALGACIDSVLLPPSICRNICGVSTINDVLNNYLETLQVLESYANLSSQIEKKTV